LTPCRWRAAFCLQGRELSACSESCAEYAILKNGRTGNAPTREQVDRALKEIYLHHGTDFGMKELSAYSIHQGIRSCYGTITKAKRENGIPLPPSRNRGPQANPSNHQVAFHDPGRWEWRTANCINCGCKHKALYKNYGTKSKPDWRRHRFYCERCQPGHVIGDEVQPAEETVTV